MKMLPGWEGAGVGWVGAAFLVGVAVVCARAGALAETGL